jgi:hypothetical protein
MTSYIFRVLDFSFKMDDDFDDYGSDISLYEESDEGSDGEYDQDLYTTYLWTVHNYSFLQQKY